MFDYCDDPNLMGDVGWTKTGGILIARAEKRWQISKVSRFFSYTSILEEALTGEFSGF